MSALLYFLYRATSERSYFFSPSIDLPPNALGAIIVTLPSWLSLAFAPIANLHLHASQQCQPPALFAWLVGQLQYSISAPEVYLLVFYMFLSLADSSLEIAWNQLPFILGMSWSRSVRTERQMSTKPRLATFALFDHGVPVFGYWWQSGRLLPGVSARFAAQVALFGTAWAMMSAYRACKCALFRAVRNWRKRQERQERHQKGEALRQADKMAAKLEARDRALQREAKEAREAKAKAQAAEVKAKQQAAADAKAKQPQLQQGEGKVRQRARKQQQSAAAQASKQEAKAKAEAAAASAAAEAVAEAAARAVTEAEMEAETQAEAQSTTETAAETTAAVRQVQVAEIKPAKAMPQAEASKQEEAAQAACADECVICIDAAPTHAAVPCGHRCLCAKCSDECRMVCPICRQEVIMFIRVF